MFLLVQFNKCYNFGWTFCFHFPIRIDSQNHSGMILKHNAHIDVSRYLSEHSPD